MPGKNTNWEKDIKLVSRTQSHVLQDCYPGFDIASEECVMELGHLITTHIGDFLHLCQLIYTTRGKVQERKTVEVLGALVSLLDNLKQN